MSDLDERRKEIRVNLPLRIWFNVLKAKEEFIRGQAASPIGPEVNNLRPRLSGKDDVERFLLYLEKKLDLLLSMITSSLSRKEYAFKALIIDISESGFRLQSPIYLSTGTLLEMGLTPPDQLHRTIDLAAEVIWAMEDPGPNEPPIHVLGVQFIDILPQDQDEIVHWIFQKQREDIRRRKDLAMV